MLMAAEERWYFTKEEINNSPSRRCGIDAEKELSYRQQGANLIQDMGQRLQVNQLAINTAIVYMHRFYMYHPFTRFHRNSIAPAALFLAAKVEEQPRKLEHVIKVAYHCLFRDQPPLDTQSEAYLERAQELVVNENILLQTLGFDVAIDHPHTHVVKCCQLVRATKDLAQTSYFMATSSLHMTTMCLQYKPTVVACVCIYIVCTWSHYEIQRATEGKDWFWYVDKSVTLELLETLTAEFLAILDKCPNRLKKIMNSSQHTDDRSKSSQGGSSSSSLSSSRAVTGGSSSSVPSSRSHDHNSHNKSGVKVPQSQPHQHPQPPKLNLKEYNEKREKERREREKMRDRDVVDPREGRQFTLVSTSHSSQSAPPSTVATIASSHSLHSVLPSSRGKSSKGSSGRSSHPEHAKASAVHSTNHKTHGHGTTNQGSRGDAQPPLEALRVGTADARQDQRREISARSDSDRFDKSNRTSSSVVDGRLLGHETKPSVSDIRQHHVVDIKHSRQSLDSAVLERKSEIKHEQRMAERKPPEPKLEQVKVKTDIKSEIKTEIKEEKASDTKSEAKEYNTIFHNSDMSDFTLNDFLSDNNFLNLNDGPPDELFDNSDSETKPDVSAILEDKSLLPQPAHQKSKSPGASQQQQQQAQHQQHHTSSINTAGVVSNASSNGEQRVSDSAATAPNYHNPRYHSATNGSVPPPQPTQTTPQHPSKSSSGSKRSRESERRNSERGEAELVPMVTKLEDTKYRTALSDPATPIKVRAEAQNLAMANATSKPTAATHSAPAPAVPEPVQKNPSEHVLRMKLPRPDHLKESQPDPATVLMVGGVAGTEHKKHKHDHPHHKHKEKKKHKHKDKDKHKDREHKEHKEHKKEKKHKKHKDKDKERDRSRGGEDAGSAPIKITIAKDKVLYTPEPGSVPLRTHSTTATPVAPPINTTSANTTPSIPKFKIQKSRLKQKDLFGGTSSTSPESSPAGDLARDTPTTSLKIKISRDRLRPDKESKKRDRDRSPGDIQAAKVPRNGSEARSTHASPQVGAGHYRQQDVRGNAHHRQYSQQQQQAQQQPPHPPLPPHAKQMPVHLQGSQAQYPRAPLTGAPPPPSAGVVPMIQPGPYSYQQFYPQYSIPPPNFSYPPPPYHHPPPPGPHGPPMPYMQAPPPAFMTGHPPLPHSTASSNPPLPAEPPPPTPPPPPPE